MGGETNRQGSDGQDSDAGQPLLRSWLKELKTLGIWIAIFGVPLAFYGLWVPETDRVRQGAAIAGFIARNWLSVPVIAGVLAVAVALWRSRRLASANHQITRLKAEITDLQAEIARLQTKIVKMQAECAEKHVRYEKFDRGRWHNFGKVNVGWIAYPPLLSTNVLGDPNGVGLDLLRELLKDCVSLDVIKEPSKWEDFETELNGTGSRFGLVATPLISTFERTKSMAFSAPLFYTNIGLFVSSSYADALFSGKYAKFKTTGLSHAAMEEILKEGDLKLVAIEGEISQNVAQRYLPKDKWPQLLDATVKTQGGLFAKVTSSAGISPIAVFSESIFWHFDPKRDQVVNILAPGKILYPVCYAFRQADFQLKNLLNVRLLKMEEGGVLKWVAKRLATSFDIPEEDVYRHYVDRWPYDPAATTADLKEAAHV